MISSLKRKIQNLLSDQKFSDVLTGSAWALLGRISSTGLGLLSTIIIARWYGADVLGVVAVIQSFLMLATILTVMGTNTSILRFIPEHLVKFSPTSAFRVYHKIVMMLLVVSLITGTIFFLASNTIAEIIFNKPHLSLYFALAAIFIVFKSIVDLNASSVRGLRLIRTFALMQALPQGYNLLLLLFLGIVISTVAIPVYAFLGSFALTGVTGCLILEYNFKKKSKPEDEIQVLPAREILSLSLPMMMTATMTFITGQTGVLLLGIFRPEAEVGYYSIAFKLATLTSFILTAVNSMAAPKFSELYHSNKMDELLYVAKKSSKLIFWTTTPILFSFILLGKPILYFIFGPEFSIAYLPLVFLVTGQFINSISGSTGFFMNMTGNQNIFRNIVFLAASCNIIINILLIPKYGIYGAAIATMISTIIWNIATLVYINKKYGKTIAYLPSMVT